MPIALGLWDVGTPNPGYCALLMSEPVESGTNVKQPHRIDHAHNANRFMALGLITVGIGIVALMVIAGMQVDGVLRDFRQRHLDQGYVEVDGRTITIGSPPSQATLIYAGHVTLPAGSDASLAIYGGDAVLEGRFNGDIAFLGDTLDLAPGAVIAGDLTLDVAKHVMLRGVVEGQVHGGADRLYGDPENDQSP